MLIIIAIFSPNSTKPAGLKLNWVYCLFQMIHLARFGSSEGALVSQCILFLESVSGPPENMRSSVRHSMIRPYRSLANWHEDVGMLMFVYSVFLTVASCAVVDVV